MYSRLCLLGDLTRHTWLDGVVTVSRRETTSAESEENSTPSEARYAVARPTRSSRGRSPAPRICSASPSAAYSSSKHWAPRHVPESRRKAAVISLGKEVVFCGVYV